MRRVWFMSAMIVLAPRVALAQPATAFEQCKARRRELTAEAMKVANLQERAKLLLAMQTCRRNVDGTTEVVEPTPPPPPPPPDTTPFSHIRLAAHAGISATTVISRDELAPMGVGPFVEVEAGYRWRRELSAVAYASYAYFRDDDVPVSNGDYIPASIISVPDRSYGLGARLNYHARAFWVGGGLGVAVESTNEYMQIRHTRILRELAGFVGYRFAVAGAVSGDVVAILGDAGYPTDRDREALSARIAIGLSW